MKFICEGCGKEFRRTPAKHKDYKKHFCSKKCFLEYRAKTGYGQPKRNYNIIRGFRSKNEKVRM